MDAFSTVKGLMQTGVAAYGAFLLVKGLVTFAGGISNHQSTEMRDGGAQAIGGGLVILGAAIIGTINLG